MARLSHDQASHSSGNAIASRLFYCAAAVPWMVGLLGIAVLAGWALDIARLKQILPGLVSMNPLTALLFITAALSLHWLLDGDTVSPRRRRAALVSASVVSLAAAIQYGGYLLDHPMPLDRILFAAKLHNDGTPFPNRIAPNTALCFVIAGIALLGLERRIGRVWVAPVLGLFLAMFSMLALLGYFFGASSFYQVGVYIPMALHTAFGFMLLSIGILFARPDRGLTAILTSPYAGGVMARRLMPVAILAPLVLAELRAWGQKAGYYDAQFGTALMVLSVIFCLVIMIVLNARSLNGQETARRRVEAEFTGDLHRKAVELEALNKELEAFSYSVSHDLRAPLRHIDGFVDLLGKSEKEVLSEKGRRYLGIISDSARQMGRLIDDLLVFCRMGRTELEMQEVDMNLLLDGVQSQLESDTADRNIEWDRMTLPVVRGDSSMLTQALVNLVSNAVKYTRPRNPARIGIGYKTDGHEKIFYVRDNGVGFDMKYADKLFGVFQRLHRDDEFEGTGIGLANVRRIITRHGGRVWAEGIRDEGAVFYFTLHDNHKGDDHG